MCDRLFGLTRSRCQANSSSWISTLKKSPKKSSRMLLSSDCASMAPISFGRFTVPVPATSVVLSGRKTKSYAPLSSSCNRALAFEAASAIVQVPRAETMLISASPQKRLQRAVVTSSWLGACLAVTNSRITSLDSRHINCSLPSTARPVPGSRIISAGSSNTVLPLDLCLDAA